MQIVFSATFLIYFTHTIFNKHEAVYCLSACLGSDWGWIIWRALLWLKARPMIWVIDYQVLEVVPGVRCQHAGSAKWPHPELAPE